MGYTESYLTARNEDDFNRAIQIIKENGEAFYISRFAYPEWIFEFTEDHPPFTRGQKAVYFCGENFIQHNVYELLNCYDKTDLAVADEETFYNIVNSANKKTKGLYLYQSEEVDPYGIWSDCTPDGVQSCCKCYKFYFD